MLAYHYLVCGHADSALNALQRVVEAEPNDQVAKRMYDALKGPSRPQRRQPQETQPPPPNRPSSRSRNQPRRTGGAHDGSGRPMACRTDGNAFDTAVNEKGEFTWKVTPKSKEPMTISGPYTVTGSAAGHGGRGSGRDGRTCPSGGPDQFQFVIAGGPPGDTGLTFKRMKTN